MPIMSRKLGQFNQQSTGKSNIYLLIYTYVNILVWYILTDFSEKIKLDWSFNWMSTSINIPCTSIAGKIAFISQACLAGSTNKFYFYQQCTYIVLSCNAESSKQQQNFTNNSRNKHRYNCFQWCSLSRPRYFVIVSCHSL